MRPRHHNYHIPASYAWIRGAAIVWLLLGVLLMMAFGGALLKPPVEDTSNPLHKEMISRESMMIFSGFFGGLFTAIPIGLILKSKWSYYGGIGLCVLCLLFFPIGTVLGIITLRAFGDGKAAFGIR